MALTASGTSLHVLEHKALQNLQGSAYSSPKHMGIFPIYFIFSLLKI